MGSVRVLASSLKYHARTASTRRVLESICRIKDETVTVSMPENGKWSQAGKIVGDDYSVCWRVLDAQYFGVPQRRKRIFLVADFAGQRAERILFEGRAEVRPVDESDEATAQ